MNILLTGGAVYDGGSITISAVVGNVVITAVAEEQELI